MTTTKSGVFILGGVSPLSEFSGCTLDWDVLNYSGGKGGGGGGKKKKIKIFTPFFSGEKLKFFLFVVFFPGLTFPVFWGGGGGAAPFFSCIFKLFLRL